MSKDKWTVISIVNEPIEVLERFVAWYLHQGADRIFLYFDDPDDAGIALMHRFGSRVVTKRCTPEFIEQLGVTDAPNFTRLQNAVVMHAYRQIKEGWVAVVDGDELIFSGDLPISTLLRDTPDDIRSVMFKPVEYVSFPEAPEQLLFRCPMKTPQIEEVFEDFAGYMINNQGFAGHTTGKTITRAGLDVKRAHPHWFVDADGNRILDSYKPIRQGFALLHFYFLNYQDWRRKIDFRVQARRDGRRDQLLDAIKRMARQKREYRLRRIWRNLHEISAPQKDRMRKCDVLLELDLDLSLIVKQHFHIGKAAQRAAE